jgi:hypothetical protein
MTHFDETIRWMVEKCVFTQALAGVPLALFCLRFTAA